MSRKKSIIPGFSFNRALGITSAKQKIARATGIPTTKQGRKRKMQSHLWTAAAVGAAAACSASKQPPQASNTSNDTQFHDSPHTPEPPKRKPLYKKWWFWVLVLIVISNLNTKITEMEQIQRERNQREGEQMLAERNQQMQTETTVATAEDGDYIKAEQSTVTQDSYAEDISEDGTENQASYDVDVEQNTTDNVTTIVVPVTAPEESTYSDSDTPAQNYEQTYVLNTSTHKFHRQSCPSVEKINPENYSVYTGTRDSVISMGYEACGRCNP